MKTPKKFCTECGRQMVLTDLIPVEGFWKYDALTGQRVKQIRLRCPKSGKCWFWEMDLHDDEPVLET